jgi:hypothetical protein
MSARWHILRTEGSLTLCRQQPPRFDVIAHTELPLVDSVKVAHQIRQDMWRAVQKVRGFSPVVTVTQSGEALQIAAGGRVSGTVPETLSAQILAVLENPEKRARWVRHAQRRLGTQ